MVIVMDMSSGERLDEFGAYQDEVLCANWLPQPELGLGLQSAVPTRRAVQEPPADLEAFLRRVYLSQE
jgi:hypothetical protein